MASTKPIPPTEQTEKGLPQVGSPENTVVIGGEQIEIKPTKLRYQRNRTAAFYKIQEMYPVADILAMEAGAFGDDRDGDKALMLFSTPYEKDEMVVVLIGLVTVNQDGTQSVEWTAYEGVGVEHENIGVEEQGCIQVELNPEIILDIQEGTALLAVVSK